MAGRIMTMQQQARELGRLRTGFSAPTASGKSARPVRSETWIVTSHAEHYVQSAADQWGGKVEKWQPQGGGAAQYRVITEAKSLDAILPGGDPLSQAYEMWSGGGAVRRCDGITDAMSDKPCRCLAQFGEHWFEQEKGKVCDPTSRLNVFLPDMPDVGVWRAETHSYYAAGEIAGAVDLIRSATSPDAVLPISLRIEQRQRKAGGQTKKFPVIVVELRGITTGQVLTGGVSQASLASSAQRQQIAAENGHAALESGGRKPDVVQDEPSTLAAINQIDDTTDLQSLWRRLKRDDALSEKLADALSARASELAKPNTSGGEQDSPENTLWQQVLSVASVRGWSTSAVEADFRSVTGVDAGKATADDMRRYLEAVSAADAEDVADDEEPPDPEEYASGDVDPANDPWAGEQGTLDGGDR